MKPSWGEEFDFDLGGVGRIEQCKASNDFFWGTKLLTAINACLDEM